jgi:hypothetical protein
LKEKAERREVVRREVERREVERREVERREVERQEVERQEVEKSKATPPITNSMFDDRILLSSKDVPEKGDEVSPTHTPKDTLNISMPEPIDMNDDLIDDLGLEKQVKRDLVMEKTTENFNKDIDRIVSKPLTGGSSQRSLQTNSVMVYPERALNINRYNAHGIGVNCPHVPTSARESYKTKLSTMHKSKKKKVVENPLKNKVLSNRKGNGKKIKESKEMATQKVSDYQQDDTLTPYKDSRHNLEQKSLDKSDDISSHDSTTGVAQLKKTKRDSERGDSKEHDQYMSEAAYEVIAQQELYRGKRKIIKF